jgi:hypothetical protein
MQRLKGCRRKGTFLLAEWIFFLGETALSMFMFLLFFLESVFLNI